MSTTLLRSPTTRNAMAAALKFVFVPHHEQCTAIYINPKEPIAQDRLLNALFPTLANNASKFDWDWSLSEGESELIEGINSCLDVLNEVFSDHHCRTTITL